MLRKVLSQRSVFLFIGIVPTFGGYILFTLYPNVLSIYYSMLEWDGIGKPTFVGLKNFQFLFTDRYVLRALIHNIFFMITVPPLIILISLLLSYLLVNKKYKGTSFYKVLFFFPNVLSSVVIALLWAFIYDGSFGLLNAGLNLVGIPMNDFYWLGDTKTAIWALVPPGVWSGVGFYVIIFMNAMVSIPKSLYESATLEGAKHTTILFKITVPLLMPIIRVGLLFLILSTLKGFENVLVMTNGGPSGSTDVIGLYMFNLAFGKEYHNYGYASAIGMLMFVILIIMKQVLDKYTDNKSVEY
jgi:N-acetylglucosamine transport system permease protein